MNKRANASIGIFSLSLGAVSNSDVGGHGFPLFSVSCSFDDLDFTDFQQLAEAFHEVQPWSSSASLALNFPSDYDVLKSTLSHDMSQETHLPRSDSVHQLEYYDSETLRKRRSIDYKRYIYGSGEYDRWATSVSNVRSFIKLVNLVCCRLCPNGSK